MFARLRQLFSTQRGSLTAKNSSVVISGDVRSSNISVGISARDLERNVTPPIREQLDQIAERLAKEKGIDEGALRSILAKLEATPVRRDEIVSKFAEAIEQLVELRTDLTRRESDDEEIDKARKQASEEISSGQFDLALSTLERGRIHTSKLTENGKRLEAAFLEDQAKIDVLRFSYRAAPEKFGHAAKIMSDDKAASFDLLAKRATALQDLGELFGDDQALGEAIEQWEAAGSLISYEAFPKQYRKAYNNLATALGALGERQTTNDLLDRAAEIQRRILAEEADSPDSFYRSGSQANLGSTLLVLGERQSSTTILREAVNLLETAIKSIDKHSRRADWTGLTSNIGNGYKLIGDLSKDAEIFDTAIMHHKKALLSVRAETEVADWIRVKTNLGGTLTSKGQLMRSAEILSEAVTCLQSAAEHVDKSKSAAQWSATNSNLATALTSLGIETNDILHFRQALEIKLSIFEAAVWDESTLPFAYSARGVGMAYTNGPKL